MPSAFFPRIALCRTVAASAIAAEQVESTEVAMYAHRRSFVWYLVLAGLVVFAVKDPSGAAYLARLGLDLLSSSASWLSRLVGSN